MFFVVTTGRSGSMTIARVLNQHPLVHCVHEPRPILIKLATEYCHHEITEDELRAYLFRPQVIFPHRVGLKLYGESDHKLSYLIPLLTEIGTSTRFIWLVRNGKDVVSSIMGRNWYCEDEQRNPQNIWEKYRLRGDLSGDVAPGDWAAMSRFDKCCWYWSYTNRVIYQSLSQIDPNNWMMVRLEELEKQLGKLQEFLELPYYPLQLEVTNKSAVPLHSAKDWSSEQKDAFQRQCGPEMEAWYPVNDQSVVQPSAHPQDYLSSFRILGSFTRWATSKLMRRFLRNFYAETLV